MALAPYSHPTTVCVVDDNESFVDSLSFELPSDWACQTFTDPFAARDYINTKPALPALADRCMSADLTSTHPTIHLDLSLIEQEINHVERFRRISVVVVDYAMPSLNGLELCAQVADPDVRKIMLTGVADEKLAVEAFNAGLIHRFVPKQSGDAINVAIGYMADLRRDYFKQYTARLQGTLAVSPPAFLVDPTIAQHLQALVREQGFVEYYLVDQPPGFLLLRSDGSMQRLLILDSQALAEQLQLAQDLGAPSQVCAELQARRAACYMSGDDPRDYFGEAYPWDEKLVALQGVAGNQDWFVGVADEPAPDIDFDPRRTSYDAYLGG